MKDFLIDVARASIVHGLHTSRPFPVDPRDFAAELRELRATFVTLKLGGNLRGCIGTLEAFRPLVVDLAENAFAAAFEDPRFPPLTSKDYAGIEIHLSLLTKPEPIRFRDEQDLLGQLRPGIDGVTLDDGIRRGTFLPSVWEDLPEPDRFLRQLKRKAGLPETASLTGMRAWRYTAESIP
jgi:AmmeMemoRadiSam system protein A